MYAFTIIIALCCKMIACGRQIFQPVIVCLHLLLLTSLNELCCLPCLAAAIAVMPHNGARPAAHLVAALSAFSLAPQPVRDCSARLDLRNVWRIRQLSHPLSASLDFLCSATQCPASVAAMASPATPARGPDVVSTSFGDSQESTCSPSQELELPPPVPVAEAISPARFVAPPSLEIVPEPQLSEAQALALACLGPAQGAQPMGTRHAQRLQVLQTLGAHGRAAGTRHHRIALYDAREVCVVSSETVLGQYTLEMRDHEVCLVEPLPAQPVHPAGLDRGLPRIVVRAAQARVIHGFLTSHLGHWTLPMVARLLYGMLVYGAGNWASIHQCVFLGQEGQVATYLRDKYLSLYRGHLVCSCTAYRDPHRWHAVCRTQIEELMDAVIAFELADEPP